MKEVIVENNVIVSDCDFYCKKPRRLKGDTINDVISFCMARYMPCQDYDNCYYKQLQKLKEENVKLKQQLEIDKNQINYFIEENEKQKEQIKQLEDFIKSDGEIDHINHEYTYKLKKENEKLKKTLQELEDLSLKTYDVADFQMYFDNLRGKNDD